MIDGRTVVLLCVVIDGRTVVLTVCKEPAFFTPIAEQYRCYYEHHTKR